MVTKNREYGVYVPPGAGIVPGGTGPGTVFFPGYGSLGVGGGLGTGGLGGGGYGGYGGGTGGFFPGGGQKAAKRAPVIPQTGLPGGAGGGAGKKAAKVPGVGVPGLYQGGLVPGKGFGGRGVLPGVATGTDLSPKSIAGGGQGGQVPGGRLYGGQMQPGVFHGYPLKSPKVQGDYICTGPMEQNLEVASCRLVMAALVKGALDFQEVKEDFLGQDLVILLELVWVVLVVLEVLPALAALVALVDCIQDRCQEVYQEEYQEDYQEVHHLESQDSLALVAIHQQLKLLNMELGDWEEREDWGEQEEWEEQQLLLPKLLNMEHWEQEDLEAQDWEEQGDWEEQDWEAEDTLLLLKLLNMLHFAGPGGTGVVPGGGTGGGGIPGRVPFLPGYG
ncbi:hypothetical protein L3Q82_004990 [Scortum barcoo]|uniref:Uncharacterized protein n=1 Tax=Scortum barcoo TaxID=214431 RepID=A0ACB8VEU5_9TELE|nr:hypothetical protein L3Q82_004990 [Scortum barcoo]